MSDDNAELQWRFANQDKTNEGSVNELVAEEVSQIGTPAKRRINLLALVELGLDSDEIKLLLDLGILKEEK